MQKYYGNYLGLCISNADPEYRGRVQIFIPHIMPALYEGWNQDGKDISIQGVGDNVVNGLNSDVIARLSKILPWAEAASPIMGGSSSGTLSQLGQAFVQTAAAGFTGGVSTAVQAVKNYFNQSPVQSPTTGGTGGNWGGSLPKLESILPQNQTFKPSNDKREERLTKDGNVSDHYLGNPNAYAVDLGVNSTFNGNTQLATQTAIETVNNIKKSIGEPPITSWSQVTNGYYSTPKGKPTPDGFRIQVIWQSQVGGNHNDHVHVGVMVDNTGKSKTATAPTARAETMGHQDPQVPNPLDGQTKTAAGQPNPTVGYEVINDGKFNTQLKQFQNFYNQNYSVFDTISQQAKTKTGYDIPPSLLASIYARESSAYEYPEVGVSTDKWYRNFAEGNEYSEGPVNTNQFISDAVDSIVKEKGHFKGVDPNDFQSQLNAAEAWNGPGYRNKPGGNPYLYNGTTGYTIGQYPQDPKTGKDLPYDPTRPDKNPGVALMLNSLNGMPIPSASNSHQLISDSHGATSTYNHNNTTKGMFSYPSPGAMLWVFFQEGNPLFPVYFAANYGKSEWQSVYKNSSPGSGYAHTPTKNNPVQSEGVVYNTGVGGFRSENTTHLTDPTQDQKSFMVYGNDGSNMFFNDGYHQIFSKYDRRDQVEGDRFHSTLGYKEELVQGSNSHTTMGDIVIRCGNTTQAAVDAFNKIQEIQHKVHAPLTQTKK